MSNFIRITATIALAGAAAAPAAAQYANRYDGRPLTAMLRANAEVPGPGKTDARGMATVRVNRAMNRLCYTVDSQRVPRATAAHIHSGRAGIAGPPVVPLRINMSGDGNACARVDRRLARDILERPRDFYVNVHSAAFPDGAIRGQLRR